MKAHVATVYSSARCYRRVISALTRYAPPWIEIVPDMASADLVVVHANGRWSRNVPLAAACHARGQRYAVIQYALRSTDHPSKADWIATWCQAEVVWSYLDLPLNHFYAAPLGVDADVFTPPVGAPSKQYAIVTTGKHTSRSESIQAISDAVALAGRRMLHVGPDQYLGPHVDYVQDISDAELARCYSTAGYVSGLRRIEGFELPAAEGLLCGARPILYDTPSYRAWYSPWGEFVREENSRAVSATLAGLFRSPPRPVSADERRAAAERFDWSRIIREFWEECR